MVEKKKRVQTDKVVHVGYSPEEYTQLMMQADAADMKLGPFVRKLSLNSKVVIKKYNMQPLIDHTTELGSITSTVQRILGTPHPDRWKYESDIESIRTLLEKLIQQEKDLREAMMRRLKR